MGDTDRWSVGKDGVMAEQRRYITLPGGHKVLSTGLQTREDWLKSLPEEDYLRYLESGENPPTPEEQSPRSRTLRNLAAGIPRTGSDLIALAGMAETAVRAGYHTLTGTGEGETFGDNFAVDLYGMQGIAEAAQWVQDETDNHLARLPAHLQNETNKKRIEAKLNGSKTKRDILLKYADPIYKAGIESAKIINEGLGLRDPIEETSADSFMQIVGGSIIPVDAFVKPTTTVAAAGAKALTVKVAKKAAELLLPGHTGGVGNLAANIGVQTVVDQGMRKYMDQPSVLTGDAMLAEEIAASGELTTDAGEQVVKTPSGRLVTPPAPDKDSEAGMGGWKKAALLSGAGTAAIIVGALRGKAARGISKSIIDDTIHGADVVPNDLVPTNKTMLRPALTANQRRYSDYINRVKPARDVAEKALAGFTEEDAQRKLEIIERFSHEAAPINIFAAAARTMRYGELPGLNRKTIPTERLEKFLSTFKPDELQAWNEGMQLKHIEGEYQKSLQGAQDQVNLAQLAIRNGTGSVQDLKRAQARLQKAQTTSPFDGMSAQDARTKMAQFDANMRNQAGERMYRQMAADLREASVRRGHYTQAEMDKIVRSNPYYVPQVNDPIAGATWWRKGGSIIKDELKGRSESRIYEKRAAVFGKAGEHERVKTPADPVTAMKKAIHDFHSYDRKNEAIAQYIDIIAGTPEWGKAMRLAHKSTTMTEFNNGKVPDSILKNNKVVVYSRNGRLHYVEMADAEVARTLAFNPGASLHMVDALRRFNQARLTGPWAPWFAWKGAKYEIGPTRMLKKDNRSFGIVQSAVKRAFPDSKLVDYMNRYVPDGTVKLGMISHIFGDITNNAVEAMSRKIASDLSFQSGFFNMLAQQPGGRALLMRVGDVMTRSFNDSMYTRLHQEGVLGQTFSIEPTMAMLKGYDSAEAITAAFKPASMAMRGYRSVLDSIRSSPKVYFFAQNWKNLEAEYKAKGQKVPKSEFDKLIYETKVASGDMTISPGKPKVSQAQSAFNYTKTTVNSLAALGEAAVKRPTDFGLRFVTTVLAPKLWTVSKISGSIALANWYWNDLNDRDRAQNTPSIKPEYFIKWAQSAQAEPPPLTPDDMMLLPDAPETTAFTSPIIAALQAMGAYGNAQSAKQGLVNAQQYMNSSAEMQTMIGDAIDSLISLPTPAMLNAIFGIKGDLIKVGTGMLTGDPAIEETVSDQAPYADTELGRRGLSVLSALWGQTADMMKHASNEIGPDDNFLEGAGKLMWHTGEQWVKKIPENMEEFGAGTLFGTQRRPIATTGTRERMTETFKKVDLIVQQRSLERRGLTDKILTDPKTMAMRDELISMLNRHGMERLKKKRGEANNLLSKLDKERYKMSTANYDTTYRRLQKDMQHINVKQQKILDDVTDSFMYRYGMSASDAIDTLAGM
jgi:hypothetical protein